MCRRGVRVSIILVAVAILILSAGCLSSSSSSQQSGTPPTVESDATDIAGTAVPGLSDEDAKERALSAEREFLSEYLQDKSCLSEWGFSAPVVAEKAVIRNRTANTVIVAVQHPYWYSTGGEHGDTYSTAIYTVTTESVERERQAGPQVC